ncbi:MAG: DUF3592 domain-containing protein [Terriglobia bacterium]
MNPEMRLALALAAAAVTAGLGAWLLASLKRWRRKSPEEIERQRRLDVNRCGRIAMGHVVDLVEPDATRAPGCLIAYTYEVAGVTYEAAQDVASLPDVVAAAHGLAGQTVSVKYDPRRPTNSIIACEDWCGIPVNQEARCMELGIGEKPEPSLPSP